MSAFKSAIDWAPTDENRWTGKVDKSWMQGRTAFGGLLSGGATDILQSYAEEGMRLRTVETSFFRPLTGEFEATGAVLHGGRNVRHVQLELHQEGLLRTRVHAVFGKDRRSTVSLESPRCEPAASVDNIEDWPFVPGLTPAYTQHFRYRMAGGALPFTGAGKGEMQAYARHRGDDHGVAAVVALMDAMPPPVLPMLSKPANASTIRWSCQLMNEPTPPQDGWYYYEGTVTAADSGYVHTEGRLYSNGQLIARMEQLVALFDA